MKFNLKQRRQMIKDDEEIQALEKRDIIQGYEEWFEGFEKELRAWLGRINTIEMKSCEGSLSTFYMMKVIREILGES